MTIINRSYRRTSLPPFCGTIVLLVVLLFAVTGCALVAENTAYTPGTTPTQEASKYSCIPDNSAQTAYVTEIVDGDTVWVWIDGESYKVRYIGINTPEIGQPGADKATNLNTDLVLNKTVTLYRDVSETDKYGRLLRYVVADGKFVNYELVAQGVAEAGTWKPDTACDDYLKSASKEANKSGYTNAVDLRTSLSII